MKKWKRSEYFLKLLCCISWCDCNFSQKGIFCSYKHIPVKLFPLSKVSIRCPESHESWDTKCECSVQVKCGLKLGSNTWDKKDSEEISVQKQTQWRKGGENEVSCSCYLWRSPSGAHGWNNTHTMQQLVQTVDLSGILWLNICTPPLCGVPHISCYIRKITMQQNRNLNSDWWTRFPTQLREEDQLHLQEVLESETVRYTKKKKTKDNCVCESNLNIYSLAQQSVLT